MNNSYIVYFAFSRKYHIIRKIMLQNILGYTKSSSKEKEEGTKRQKAKGKKTKAQSG